MPKTPSIYVALNIRSAEQGFILEFTNSDGEGTTERVFAKFEDVCNYISGSLNTIGTLNNVIIKHIEDQATDYFSSLGLV